MTEYRIVTTIDPSGVVQGGQRVKQELRNIDTAAADTKQSINRAFDQSQLDKSVGSLVARMESLESVMTSLTKQAQVLSSQNRTLGASTESTARSQKDMENATLRVLRAVDAEAAELTQLNNLLNEARVLYERGAISSEQFARVQTMVDNGVKKATTSVAQQRAGYTQLGFQIQDITQTMALGINPLVVLAQQGGQTASALSLALGEAGVAGRVATFLAGPWGSIIIAATAVLGTFALTAEGSADALQEEIDKLKEDAAQSEVASRAKEAFGRTIDGVTAAIVEQNEALKKSQTLARQAELDAYALAKANLQTTVTIRAQTEALLERNKAEIDGRIERLRSGTGVEGAGAAAAGLQSALEEQTRLQAELEKVTKSRAIAEERLRRAEIPINQRAVAEALDDTASATGRYEKALQRLNNERARGVISQTEYTKALVKEQQARDRAIEEARKQERAASRTPSDGVSRFKSQGQAIGIAGRELQRQGLRVSENEQFGGITAGAHKSSHVNAIDVNFGKGKVEADLPDLKARFDRLARDYQARGYRVLWNGMVWDAGGNGPSRPIKGSDKHYDHMHLEAPSTIVGKATGASTQSQAEREANAEERRAEQASDFVQNIVDQANARGQGNTRADGLKTQIDRTLADFKRRFDRAAGPDETAEITKALTEAEARETAQRFDEAYVQPLQRLKDLQGKTGLDREVLNAQLEESARLGRDLEPAEKQKIENSIRLGDAMERQTAILEGIRAPLDQYKAQIEALNALLQSGAISQDQFNQEVASLPLNQENVAQQNRLSGGDERLARIAQEAQAERDLIKKLYDAKIIDLIEFNRRKAMIDKQAATAQRQVALSSTEELFGSLADIAESSLGKQSAVYKAAFAIQKAAAIAQSIVAIQTGIAQALSLPFPANLVAAATVAAQAASIISNIKSVSLALADGGYVSGPGGARDDKIPARLSNGEFVVNAAATARNRPLLEAINSGTTTARQKAAAQETVVAQGGAGDSIQLSFGDVIVQTGGVGAADGAGIGREVKAAIQSIARDEIMKAKRVGGVLTKTRSSVMAD